MAHEAQMAFCHEVNRRWSVFFDGRRVLEIGSRNINGSVRSLFRDCDYVGVDCTAGEDVDIVCLGHQYNAPPGSFDVVCSTEVLEHDPHAELTVRHMLHLLRDGGLFFVTCASEGRREHGTQRSGKIYGPDPDFYRNVSFSMLLEWLVPFRLSELYVRHNRTIGDLYVYATKAEE